MYNKGADLDQRVKEQGGINKFLKQKRNCM